ncbi:hypothetical protein ACSSS7_004704 [Eimeria intestinalis]
MADDAALVALLHALAPRFSAGQAPPNTLSLSKEHEEWGGHDRVVGLCKSLQARDYLVLKQQEKTLWLLTQEGESYANEGTPEFRLLTWFKQNHQVSASSHHHPGRSKHAAPSQQQRLQQQQMQQQQQQQEEGHDVAALRAAFGTQTDVALSNAMKLGWLRLDKATKRMHLHQQQTSSSTSSSSGSLEASSNVVDSGRKALEAIRDWHLADLTTDRDTEKDLLSTLRKVEPSKQPDALLTELKKRKLVETKKLKFWVVEKGEKFQLELRKPLADLNAKIIATESWKQQEIKPYNFFASGKRLRRGAVHPLMMVQKQFKHTLTAMGFEEMATNQYVDSSFWCFDSLFMPQQHPARDAQDTFFIKSPEHTNGALLEQAYVARVGEIHEKGGSGSEGWQYKWSYDEALKNVMRTHTTSVSARMLYGLAQEYKRTGVFNPKKLFSIDRVFRNETLDATHLAEFHQARQLVVETPGLRVEGVVAGRDLSLGHLMGVMKTFYKAIGIEKLKFKPAFNPYTEPSMEIFGYHPGLARPEMLLPMGLPEDVTVIAWGLSLERPTMIKYGITNIRELFGPKALLAGV